MLVDTGATHSYISKQFFEQIKKLDYEIKKPINDKLIVANGQKLKITGQMLIPMEVGHIKKYLLCRLVPEFLGIDITESSGLKLDFEKKICWLPEKPQIKYKIEPNPKKNRVKWNEDEKGITPKKDSQEGRMSVGNRSKLRKQEKRPVVILQGGEIPNIIPTNHTLPKVGQITDTKWPILPVRKRNLSPRENK